MKILSRLANVGLSLFFCSFLLLAGCGDKESSNSSPAVRFKEGMLDLSKRMVKIAEDIESAKDAEAAEPKVAEIMEDVVALLNGILNDVDAMTEKERKEFDTIVTDPELKEWNDKMIAQMDKLKNEHPEAAAKLEEIMRRQSQKMAAAMDALGRKMAEKMGSATKPVPEPMEDSAGAGTMGDSVATDTAR